MRYRVNDLDGDHSRFLPDGFGAEISWFATASDADKATSALLQRDGGAAWSDEACAIEWRKGNGEDGLIANAAHITVERYQRVYDNGAVIYGLYVWGYKSAEDRIFAYSRVSDAIYGPSLANRRETRSRRAVDAWTAIRAPRRDLEAALGTA